MHDFDFVNQRMHTDRKFSKSQKTLECIEILLHSNCEAERLKFHTGESTGYHG
jgi:hypothetical protein